MVSLHCTQFSQKVGFTEYNADLSRVHNTHSMHTVNNRTWKQGCSYKVLNNLLHYSRPSVYHSSDGNFNQGNTDDQLSQGGKMRVSVDQIAGSQTAGCVRVIQDNLYPGLTTILTMPHQII